MASAILDSKDGIIATGYTANANIGPFILLGGKYAVQTLDTGTVAVALYTLGPDGATWVLVDSFTTDMYDVFDLPPGTYTFVVGAGATLCAVSVAKIPYIYGM